MLNSLSSSLKVKQKNFLIMEEECHPRDNVYYERYFVNGYTPKSHDDIRYGGYKIGHLINIRIPESEKKLIPDLTVCDPEMPSIKKSIVGLIGRIYLEGEPTEQIFLSGKISFQNRAILQEALCSGDNPFLEIEFVVYDYDFQEGKYFKRCYTQQHPLNLVITEGRKVNFQPYPEILQEAPLFAFDMPLSANPELREQKFGFAFSATGTRFTYELRT